MVSDWIGDTSNQNVGPGFCHLEWAHGGLHLCHVCCPDHADILEARVVSSGLDLCEVTVHVRIADQTEFYRHFYTKEAYL
jgi:hypothetical protein